MITIVRTSHCNSVLPLPPSSFLALPLLCAVAHNHNHNAQSLAHTHSLFHLLHYLFSISFASLSSSLCFSSLHYLFPLSQMSTSVDTLVTNFEKNILDSFTTETLELAAQEIVDVRMLYWFDFMLILSLFWVDYVLFYSHLTIPCHVVQPHLIPFTHIIYSLFLPLFISPLLFIFLHLFIYFYLSLSYFFFLLSFLSFFKDSLIKKGQRKRLGKLVVLEDLSKTWELNEKRDRAAFLEKLFKDGPPAVRKIPNLIQHPIHIDNQSSGSDSPHRNIPHIDATASSSSTKYSPRLTPLLFTPALPNSL